MLGLLPPVVISENLADRSVAFSSPLMAASVSPWLVE